MSFAARPIGLHVTGEFVFNDVIDSDVTNYNLRARAVAAGWDQVVPLIATTIINSGIVLSADSISQYGFDTGTTFPAGTTLALVNNGFVIGMGGEGGLGRAGGSMGGPALRAQAALSVTNNGTIGGGGGGGGGGVSSGYDYIYGGGGRSGRTNSSASGAAQAGTFTKGGNSSSGATGGTTAAGASYFSSAGGAGGGGGWGADGGTGYDYTAKTTRSGGAGGAAVVGNANITWINTGTRYGAIT